MRQSSHLNEVVLSQSRKKKALQNEIKEETADENKKINRWQAVVNMGKQIMKREELKYE